MIHDREYEISEALNAAQLAIDEYYTGDRAWAEQWLLLAHRVNVPPAVMTAELAEDLTRRAT